MDKKEIKNIEKTLNIKILGMTSDEFSKTTVRIKSKDGVSDITFEAKDLNNDDIIKLIEGHLK